MKQTALAAALLLCTVGLSAQPGPNEQPAGPQGQQTPSEDALGGFAGRHGLSRGQLTQLRRDGMSWKEIGSAAWLSEHGKRPMSEVVAARRSGASWRELAGRYGVDYKQMQRGARSFERGAMQAERSDARGQGDRDRLRDRDGSGDRDRDRDRDRLHDGGGRMERRQGGQRTGPRP